MRRRYVVRVTDPGGEGTMSKHWTRVGARWAQGVYQVEEPWREFSVHDLHHCDNCGERLDYCDGEAS